MYLENNQCESGCHRDKKYCKVPSGTYKDKIACLTDGEVNSNGNLFTDCTSLNLVDDCLYYQNTSYCWYCNSNRIFNDGLCYQYCKAGYN